MVRRSESTEFATVRFRALAFVLEHVYYDGHFTPDDRFTNSPIQIGK